MVTTHPVPPAMQCQVLTLIVQDTEQAIIYSMW